MTEKQDAGQGISKIIAALCKAQSSFDVIPKTKDASIKGETRGGKAYEYNYKYADLPDILNEVRPKLNKQDITLMQPVYQRDEWLVIKTLLIHTSGETLDSGIMPAAPLNAGLTQQKILGAVTYARRIQLCPMIGISAEEATSSNEEEDNDPVTVTIDKPKPVKRTPPPPPGGDAGQLFFNPEEFLEDIETQFIAAGKDHEALNEIWIILDGEDRLVGPDLTRAKVLAAKYLGE